MDKPVANNGDHEIVENANKTPTTQVSPQWSVAEEELRSLLTSLTLTNDGDHQILEQSSPSKDHSASLMSLAVEIRLEIYSLVLTTTKPKVLRSKLELTSRPCFHRGRYFRTPKLANVSLLMTSRQIFEEAVAIFYEHHTFHYSILRSAMRYPPLRLKYLPLIKHLSIDYTSPWPRTNQPERVDERMANHFDVIKRECKKLRTFTIHILATLDSERRFEPFIWPGRTSTILNGMYLALDRLSIIAFGPMKKAVGEFCLAVTGNESNWHLIRYQKWPGMSISDWELCGMQSRDRHHYYLNLGPLDVIQGAHLYKREAPRDEISWQQFGILNMGKGPLKRVTS